MPPRRTTAVSQYVIFTDSGCDISPELLKEWGVKCLSLIFRFTDSDTEYTNNDMPAKEFYDAMRAGKIAKTSAVNVESFKEAFEEELKNGNDVLYLGFSGGLSNTANAGRLAADELAETYTDRKILTVDSLCASAGQGLLLRLALDKKEEGASIEELAEYLEGIKLNLAHWFSVDDLVYLKRGGRVSPTVALIGTMLSIKPVMHVDNEGHLVKVSQARGRKAALKAMADKYTETALDPENGYIYISNADCMDDVNRLADMIKAKHGNNVNLIMDVGPVIGAHSGPGTIALFYLAKER